MEHENQAGWSIAPQDLIWAGHRVRDAGVFPAAGYLEWARRSLRGAGPELDSALAAQWSQVFWMRPWVASDETRKLEITFPSQGPGAFVIRPRPCCTGGEEDPLCRGNLVFTTTGLESATPKATPESLLNHASKRYGREQLYARLTHAGIHYAHGFRVLEEFFVTERGGVGRVQAAPEEADVLRRQICLIDALMQSALLCAVEDSPLVPFSIESLVLPRELPSAFLVEATLLEAGAGGTFYRFGLQVYDPEGSRIGEGSDLCLKSYPPSGGTLAGRTASGNGQLRRTDSRPEAAAVLSSPLGRKQRNRIAVAGSFTVEPVEPSLSFWLTRSGFPHPIEFAPYNQLHQELLNPESLINEPSGGGNVLMFRWQDLRRSSEKEPETAGSQGAEGTLPDGRGSVTEPEPAGSLEPGGGVQAQKFVLPNGMEIAHLNAYETEYLYHEIFLEQTYLKHGIVVREGDTVIDIGANIGMFSLFLASRLARVCIYALEPSPVTFSVLKENAARHAPGKIIALNAGAGGECRAAQFTFYPHSSVFSGFHSDEAEDSATIRKVIEKAFSARGLSPEATREYIEVLLKDRLDQQTFECRLRTVESIVQEHGLERVDLLKVDAEKCESEILGAITPEGWSKIRQVVVETHERAGNRREALVALLQSKGFTVEIEEEVLLGESGLSNLYARKPMTEEQAVRPEPAAEIESRLEELLAHLRISAARQAAPCVLCLCPSTPGFEAGLAPERIAALKQRIREELGAISTVHFLDASEWHARYHVNEIHDPEREAMGEIPFTEAYYAFLGTLLARRLYGEWQRPCKVIALDCDQTLWQGVCGEDALEQIQLGPPHLELQRRMLERHAGGSLLTLVSKNQEADVRRVFEGRPDMVLKWRHICAHRINWKSKAENLQSLAQELGLGLDSFVFLDDNPVECAEVRARLPEVLTLELPGNPAEIPGWLDHVWALDQWSVTTEDQNRNTYYQQSRQRNDLQKHCATFKDFIEALALQVEIREPLEPEWKRVAQLFNRTNQFNFTGRRMTEAQLREWLGQEGQRCGMVRVSDRFGDYGLVGAFLARLQAGELVVENFVLSCRVLGRGVEHRVLAHIGGLAQEHGKSDVLISYAVSARNEPVRKFLGEQGASLPAATDEVAWVRFAAEQLSEWKFDPQGTREQAAAGAPLPRAPAGRRASGQGDGWDRWDRWDGSPAGRKALGQANELFNEWVRGCRTQQEIHRAVQAGQSAPEKPAVAQALAPGEALNAVGRHPGGIEAYLVDIFRAVLKLKGRVAPEASYEQMGLNSFKIIEIILRLEKDFGRLPKTLLFEYLTIRDLADYFAEHHPARIRQLAGSAEPDINLGESIGPRTLPDGRGSARGQHPSTEPRPSGSVTRSEPANTSAQIDTTVLAIVGLGGRYPLAPDLETFWNNLKSGRDCIRPAGKRWNYHPYFSAANQSLLNSYTIQGGFLEEVDCFDPLVFQIAPSDAERMDPQQRLFLQVAMETLEDAGYGAGVADGNVGVFVGVMTNTYGMVGLEHVLGGGVEYPDYDHYEIPNRVSFFFDFKGPSLAVDSACSSSLTAIHLACDSIRRGECASALAGGVNLILHPGRYVQYCQKNMLSPEGQSKAFGAAANGFVDGEGVGCVYIKPLEQAVADGDSIYAVIKASHISGQGRTSGFTVPNPAAQRDLIARALEKGGIDPDTITYVEAHGTGTALGDPIEIRGLTEAFRKQTARRNFCAIGSVKSNIGHLEAAAGIAGLTKVLLQLRHRQLVPTLHAAQLNPNIDFAETPFRVQRVLEDWAPQPATAGEAAAPRRAGISSFGAGGAHAHLIVEEYADARPVKAEGGQGPELIVLSAWDDDRLTAYADKLRRFLVSRRDSGEPVSLPDVAFTLQVGRRAMNARLALVVNSAEQLIARLEEVVHGAAPPENAPVFRGHAREDRAKLETLFAGPAGKAMVDWLLQNRHWEKLASIWVMGIEVDWSRLHAERGSRRRISLPVYPFKAKRYWLPQAQRLSFPSGRGESLLKGEVVFESSLGEAIAFRSVLSAHWPLLDQHRVEGERVLPGVGHLELVCQARGLRDRLPFEISKILWRLPVRSTGERTELFAIFQKQHGLQWEICDQTSEPRAVYSQGNLALGIEAPAPPARPLAVDAVRAQCPHPLSAEAFYAQWQARGIEYGPFYKGVRAVWRQGLELAAEISLDAEAATEGGAYCLHPGLMDAILQAAASLFLEETDPAPTPLLPFALESLRVYRVLPSAFFAVARREGPECHVWAVTGEGELLLEMNGLAFRAAPHLHRNQAYFVPQWSCEPLETVRSPAGLHPEAPAARQILVCHWPGQENLAEAIRQGHPHDRVRALPWETIGPAPGGLDPKRLTGGLDQAETIEVMYFLGGLAAEALELQQAETFERSQEKGVFALFRLLQGLRATGRLAEALELRVATRASCVQGARGTEAFWNSGLVGFCQSLRQEFPNWKVSCLATDLEPALDSPRIARHLTAEPALKPGEAVAHIVERRWVRRLTPIQLAPAPATKFRTGGVYLILGGAGGIGAELSYYLAAKYQARLVLIGRSPRGVKQERQLEKIRALGGEGLYVACDATALDPLQEAVRQGRERFGQIHGVFHSALVLEDRGFLGMDEAGFRAAWKPKAEASVNLARVFAGANLDFLVFFSSAQSFFGNAGQCNYAAGCAFQDEFARSLRTQLACPVQTINWGYWGTVGIVSGEAYRQRFLEQGILSIAPEEGFQALERILGQGLEQVVYYQATQPFLEKMGVDFKHLQRLAPASGEPVLAAAPDAFEKLELKISPPECAEFIQAMTELDGFCARAFLGFLQQFMLPQARALSLELLNEHLRVAPRYQALMDSLLEILQGKGLVRVETKTICFPEGQPQTDAETLRREAERLGSTWPKLAGHLRLAQRCLEHFADILSGAAPATDILFPEGALDLVQPIYQSNPASDDFNQIAAACLERLVARRRPASGGTLQILEVGAGTGGTSVGMLEGLERHREAVAYTYTDISTRFLQHGQERFGQAYGFVQFKRLDIEQPIEPQGFQPGGYDVVIATNVLHATADLAVTLRNVKGLLRRNGVLILNEVTRRDLFLTLTFGLLDGWWKFRDPRLPGAPLLSERLWRRLLRQQGFHSVRTPEGQARWQELPACQTVLLAESDGLLGLAAKLPATGGEVRAAAGVPPPAPAPRLTRPCEAAVAARPRRMDDSVRAVLSQVLQIDPQEFDAEAPYTDFGVDSILAVKIIHQLNERLGTQLRTTDLFSYTSIARLAEHLETLPREAKVPEPAALDPGTQGKVPRSEPANTSAKNDAQDSAARPERPREIAIIGMAGQFPGARNLEEFWDNLVQGRNSIQEVDALRWDPVMHFDARPNQPNKTYSKWGGWLTGIELFDPLFFNISPREAQYMDPKQRLFLQAAWSALEDAGQVEAPGVRKCGVFVGCSPGDYKSKLKEHGVTPDTYTFVGNSEAILAARISYFLNLQGPAVTLDTACSSSLMAIHLACESLRSGACDLAIAGGVCVLTTAEFHIQASQAGMLSPGGQCRAFDHRADGFVPAEGVGAVVLKDLQAALRDGDTIHAVINGCGVNQDGRTNGITAPSAASQTRLELEVYERFGLHPEQIQYVEAHGTGTRLGDPIEVNALIDAFRTYTARTQFCGLGSVKTNIGHCLAAAGIAGLLKVVLCLKHGQLVPSLHLQKPNEHIPFAGSPFYVVTQAQEWHAAPQPRQAMISSFGFSGTNVHLAVREAPAVARNPGSAPWPLYPVVFSAKSEGALVERLKRFAGWMDGQGSPPPMEQVSFSCLTGRGRFAVRQALLAPDWRTLRERIGALLNQGAAPEAWRGNADVHPVTMEPAKQAAAARFLKSAPGENAESFHRGLAEACELWASGYDLDLSGIFGDKRPQRLTLPTYPFERKAFWIPGVPVAGVGAPAAGPAPERRHPLLHAKSAGAAGEQRFESIFDGSEFFFREHQYAGKPMLPGVAFIEMVREAGARASGKKVAGIRNLVWVAPLTHPGKALKVEVILDGQSGLESFVVKSYPGGQAVLHAQGRLIYRPAEAPDLAPETVDLEAIRRRCANRLDGAECYARLGQLNLELGPHFQTIQELRFNESESLAELKLTGSEGSFELHPGILDGTLQALLGIWGSRLESLPVPYSMEELTILGPMPSHGYAHAAVVGERNNGAAGHQKYELQLVNPAGQVVLRIRGFYPRAFHSGAAKPVAEQQNPAVGGFAVAEWAPAPWKSAEAQPALLGNGLVFDVNDVLLAEFRKRSEGHGAMRFVGVRPGDRYRYVGNQVYEINPLSRADHERLLTVLARQGYFPGCILHYWSQDPAAPRLPSSDAGVPWSVGSFIHLCQALLNSPAKNGQAVKVEYAFSTQDAERRPGYAAVAGLIRCLNRESAALQAGQLELQPGSSQMNTAQLAALVAGLTQEWLEPPRPGRNPEARLENGQRFERHWRAAALGRAAQPGAGLREGASYLITGGLGGIGGLLAERLAREYRAKLVLLGRSPLSAGVRERLAHLEDLGGTVKYFSCDLADPARVAEVFGQVQRECGGLHGVFHCAGVTADSYLARKTPEQFAAVFKPKIQGLEHLDAATAEHPLEFVCLFSSLAAAVGNPGQSDYALANAFLDRFAEYREGLRQRQQRSGITLSINWPLWEQGGMAVEQAHAGANPIQALSPLTAEQGWQFVRAALASGLSGSCACHPDREILLSLLNGINLGESIGTRTLPDGRGSARLQHLSTEPRPSGSVTSSEPASSASPQSGPSAAGETKAALVALLKQWVCDIMLLEPGAVLDKKELGAYGFDSISFTRLANQVNERFHLDISPALFFEFPTLEAVSAYLLKSHDLAAMLAVNPALAITAPDGRRLEGEKPSDPRREPPGDSSPEPIQSSLTKTEGLARLGGDREAIAIIGMSGVLPESPDLEAFWQHLKEGHWLVREIPAERWDWREFSGDPATEDNKTRIKFAGFMPGVEEFDAGFFGISPREADLMDPQQRIFLQTVWHAIEDAGYRASALAGRNIGVFAGVSTSDYFELLKARGIRIEAHTATGMAHSVLANRISYLLDLRGPSEPVDTACSSSLIALHRAVEALRAGGCEMAIAGGVNVILTPTLHIAFGKAGMLAEDGKCKTFDERADGYVRGEGCGAVLLKPLGQALADGDCIHAVIRASQENHGGRAQSLTAPNPQAQSRLIAQAIREAGIDPASITYVETHGTGTRLGDPIEVRGLTAAFEELFERAGRQPRPAGYCGLGSVKTNVGHLEAAAGMAGLLKVVLAMKHRLLPATLHFQRLNANIRLAETPFYIVDTRREWKPLLDADGRAIPRRAGLSSFGFGGANAHLILEEAPVARPWVARKGPYLIVLSAKNQARLTAAAGKLQAFLQAWTDEGAGEGAGEEALMTSLAYTLQTGREALEVRAACLVASRGELLAFLKNFLDDHPGPGWFGGSVGTGEAGGEAGLIEELCRNQQWEALARLWVRGAPIDWKQCYGSEFPAKMALPGYPFAPERHWIPPSQAKTAEPGSGHPLLDGMDARASLGPGVAFSKRLHAEEPVCRDHRVQGRRIFPAVAYLEMALAAAERSTPYQKFQVSQACWLQPVVVETEARDLTVLIKPSRSGLEFQFEISSRGPSSVLHSTGQIAELDRAFSDAPAVVPRAFMERATSSVSAAALYEALAAKGYDYGLFFRGVQKVWLGEGEALAEMQVPPEMAEEARRYGLPPTILDGALQALSVFYREMAAPILPFSVERVEVGGRCGNRCFAYVRREGEHRFYIEILDEAGRVCVRLRDFCYREWSGPRESIFYATRWVRQALEPARTAAPAKLNGERTAGALVIRCSPAGELAPSLQAFLGSSEAPCGYVDLARWIGAAGSTTQEQEFHEALDRAIGSVPKVQRIFWIWEPATSNEGREVSAANVKDKVTALIWFYRMLKELLAHPSIPDGCRFHLLTCASMPVFEEEPGCPAGAALWGLLRAVAPEYPRFEFRCLDLEALPPGQPAEPVAVDSLFKALHAEPQIGEQNQAGLRAGHRYVRQLGPVELPKPAGAPPAFRTGGLYVIVGWRGLGAVLGEYLQTRYQARVVFLGRSAGEEAQRALAERQSPGAGWQYLQADFCDARQCAAAFDRIRREHGAIAGVIHAAMDLQDQSFHRMDEGSFLAALAAKSLGTLHLLECLKQDRPDFVLLFSSLQSWVTNPGQGNYAAGCCFQDLAGRSLGRLPYPVKVINWSHWSGVGAVSNETHQQKLRGLGLEAISPAEGLEAMERVLACGLPQCFVIKAQAAFFQRYQVQTGPTRRVLPGRASVWEALEKSPPVWDSRACLDFQRGLGRLEHLGRILLAHRLRQAGIFEPSSAPRTLPEWRARLRCVEPYPRWLPVLWQMLAREGLGALEPDGFRLSANALAPFWFQANHPGPELDGLIEGGSTLAPFARLLKRCLEALPAVLSGQTPITEVLFPNASMDLLAGIYQDNEFSDAFNQVARHTILSYVQARRQAGGERLRILEVGAGTGGTTGALLEALAPHAGRLNYCYTDISDSFLQYGRSHFGPAHPFVEFRYFNVEEDPAAQGFQEGQFDVIVAANVLHATRNIRATLRQLQPLVKPGGWLVLNEATCAQDFLSLTFGLTPGWWLFEDAGERCPHSPLLSVGQWETVLRAEGFGKVRVAGMAPSQTPPVEALRQNVIVAETTGIIAPAAGTGRAGAPKTPSGARATEAGAPAEIHAAAPSRTNLPGPPEVTQVIREALQKVLQTTHTDFDERQPFANFGLDSILAVEVIRQINQRLGIRLRTTDLFNFSSIERLHGRIREALASPESSPNGESAVAGELPDEVQPVERPARQPETYRREAREMAVEPRRIFEQLEAGELNVEEAFSQLRGGGL
jgi:rhizoxin synthesis polyketide synthase/nonribosomal peptide synthetase RhiB